jgi:GNAT superfamily N-acetyltransferase
VKRIMALTDADLKAWMQKLMPEGTRCMFIASLTVDPKFQRRGVSRALLKWGTDTADRLGLFIWVHSSQGAVKAYEAGGFERIGNLEMDLDEYAPCPPPKELDHDGSGKWGRYELVYLKYLPK